LPKKQSVVSVFLTTLHCIFSAELTNYFHLEYNVKIFSQKTIINYFRERRKTKNHVLFIRFREAKDIGYSAYVSMYETIHIDAV